MREVAEPEEEENTEPEDEAEDPEKRRNTDITTETPTETNERCDRTRQVPGGAWLTQAILRGGGRSQARLGGTSSDLYHAKMPIPAP
ncbi:hypothetical protein NDU88_004955 [Pleurodeles waltl]|uniref:Uncharacterized protein n=1 Tax=Pleurodeles waltl TaxID=8319 RepID=A0AAV7PE30_PLEWA|nr:hypothetical protein NDU88_004955 [Pleurodeles waltl]